MDAVDLGVNLFVTLFALLDPIGNLPIFAAATAGATLRQRISVSALICAFAAVFLAFFLFTGLGLLQFFGISLAAFRIAGGILLLFLGLDMARDQAQSAVAHGWLVTPDNSRMSQLLTGFDYLRLNLRATAAGIAFHPMSQLLQEYQEMASLQQEAFGVLGVEAPARVQMLVRLGYAAAPGPSPRRPVSDIVVA